MKKYLQSNFTSKIKTFSKFLLIYLVYIVSILQADYYNSNIINVSFSGTDTLIIIEKDLSIIQILQIDRDSTNIITSFDLLPLPNLDNKNLAKDNGTPEGIYFINDEINLSNYTNNPEEIAIILNYPNPADIYNKRTGSDIWIQNPTDEIKKNQSCFYLKNNDLAQLKKYIKFDITPILILKNSPNINLKPIENKQNWITLIDKWKNTFSSKRLIAHFQMYITESDDIDFEYANKINKIMSSTNSFYEFKIDNLIVLSTPEESIASFYFTFKSTEINIEKQFNLSFLSIDNEWKIFSENANYKPQIRLDSEQKITNIIIQWKNAWENKNFETYISFYSKLFSDINRNYRQFYNFKRKTFRNIKEIKVSLQNIDIQNIENNQWKATFIQDYWTPNYQDYGIKSIYFENINNNFMIIREEWEEIQPTF